MSDEGVSLSALKQERDELVKDLEVFSESYNLLCRRLIESNDLPRARRPLLHEWSGSRAVVGSMEMAIHAIERTVAETDELILKVEAGEIKNTDRPQFGVIDGGRE
jgi:hypothetical protein